MLSADDSCGERVTQSAKLLFLLLVLNKTCGIGLLLFLFWKWKRKKRWFTGRKQLQDTCRLIASPHLHILSFLKFIYCQMSHTSLKNKIFSLIASLIGPASSDLESSPSSALSIFVLLLFYHISSFLRHFMASFPCLVHAGQRVQPLTTFRCFAWNPMAVSQSINAFWVSVFTPAPCLGQAVSDRLLVTETLLECRV